MLERFASLQKLLSLLNDLGNQVTWSKKRRVRSPKKPNRRSKERAPQGVGLVSNTDLDSSIYTTGYPNQFSDRIKISSDADNSPRINFKRLQLAEI